MSNIKENEKKGREFGLSSLSLENRTSVFIIALIVVVAGFTAYKNMPKELFPEIVMPTIYVSTVHPGNSPLDIENLITRPIEKEIKPIKGIKTLKSTSVQDYSAIFVEFNPDVDVKQALLDVKDAVDKAKKELPSDLDNDPVVMDIDFSEFPVMNINLSGDYSLDDLKEYGEDLQDKIELLPEISKVDLKGALDREVLVNVDVRKIEAVEVSFMDIENAIAYENMTISGGDILMDGTRRNIRVVGEFKSVDQLENIIIKHERGNTVYLRDVATIVDAYKERSSFARLDGQPVVSLDVIKKSGENLLNATDKIEKILADAKKKKLPSDLVVTITNDQSEQTRDQLLNLVNSIISGVILVVLILLFFLGLRNALFVGIAIPMSMLMSFFALSMMDITINMMVLFSLILALGMLVDNAIVVIENIYRLYDEKGFSPLRAAREGVGEIAVPIISSTATTLAAFFPLLFWDDIMGEFMKYLPMTLIIVLSSSLFVGLVINPVVAATWIKKEDVNKKINLKRFYISTGILIFIGLIGYVSGSKSVGNLMVILLSVSLIYTFILIPVSRVFQKTLLPWLDNKYQNIVRSILQGYRPFYAIIGTMMLLIFSVIFLIIRKPNIDLFPANEPKYINIFIEAPIGTDILQMDTIVRDMETQVDKILTPYRHIVNSVITNIGEGANDPMDGPSQGNTPNKARITVSFHKFELRDGIATSDVMKALSHDLKRSPGVLLSVDKNRDGPPVGKPINIEITGEDYDKLLSITEDVQQKIESHNIPGIEGLKIDLDNSKPEIIVDIDRVRARRFGLSTAQIGSTFRTALFGKEVSKYKEGEDDYPIILKLEDKQRYDLASLMNQRITFRDQSNGQIVQVPISAVAEIRYNTSYGSVKRKNLDRAITLYSNVIEGYNGTAINDKIREVMADYQMPDGYLIKFTGKEEEQAKSMAFLGNALLIAVALIFLIMVSQFNSAIKPFIIITSVFFSTIGVFLGLAIFRMDFIVIMTGIGIVSLAGIVVNNAIVLIDYTDLLRKRKREELGYEEGQILSMEDAIECIVEAGKTRLRPVLLTAITTVLGLIPLAVGLNIDFVGMVNNFNPNIYMGGDNVVFWGPMSWTVIFGLTFATFLTLVIVPAMYLIADMLLRKVTKNDF